METDLSVSPGNGEWAGTQRPHLSPSAHPHNDTKVTQTMKCLGAVEAEFGQPWTRGLDRKNAFGRKEVLDHPRNERESIAFS